MKNISRDDKGFLMIIGVWAAFVIVIALVGAWIHSNINFNFTLNTIPNLIGLTTTISLAIILFVVSSALVVFKRKLFAGLVSMIAVCLTTIPAFILLNKASENITTYDYWLIWAAVILGATNMLILKGEVEADNKEKTQ